MFDALIEEAKDKPHLSIVLEKDSTYDASGSLGEQNSQEIENESSEEGITGEEESKQENQSFT
eukprot:CAMPEP_0114577150 /NCGR_PEP_ID=MMETSP0125-20121206/1842_1 /TAXON_ID=485358 ORGANISM="Aristerostoma sp., Strain ATCC 50986" /NCGR_SAMPLE_ID=MMETSP0125 /ASSEMBLY_ACC=CAM_ASM_000245 /LENGTH=62 /DNA_ID=CAMNT_0001766237 /DNA_START=819 /DNA_END=1007 /DNA_ORIENTATION=+